MSVQAEWTLENLLKLGEGNKPWICDWKLPLGKQDDGGKFEVPADWFLKGSVIQVVKAVRHQIVFKPLKLRRYSGGTGRRASWHIWDGSITRWRGRKESSWSRTIFIYSTTTRRQNPSKVWTNLEKQASLQTTSGSLPAPSRGVIKICSSASTVASPYL